MWKHALSALSLLNGWMDFKGICTDKSLENGKELIRFSDLAFMRSKMSKMPCPYHISWRGRYIMTKTDMCII